MPIHYEVRETIATLTIEGEGSLNLLTPELVLELGDTLRKMDEDSAVRVAILTGIGAHFSGGSDARPLRELLANDGLETILAQYWNPHDPLAIPVTIGGSSLFSRPTVKPVVGAIVGECFDDALAAVGLHTNIRIAGTSARFGFPAIRRGLGGAFAVRSRLARQIPRAVLLWLIETGQELDSSGAFDCFLVNEVVPDNEVLDRARAVAAAVTELAPEIAMAEMLSLVQLEDGRGEDGDFPGSSPVEALRASRRL